jgi:transposase
MKALPILDTKATGIDVGSERLHVSVGGEAPTVFGTMTRDVQALVSWLVEHGVRSVAMEATGVYWLYLFEALEGAGIEVLVVNGRHVKNLPGRKTDMADCQWLATLHAHGLLRSGFVPPEHIRRLRDYLRLRQDHIGLAASHVQHMQKALERMNVKLHDVIASLVGVSGLKVVRAIVAGQRDPQSLLDLCDVQIRKHKADRVRESLRGTWRAEHLFALRQALQCWEFYQERIKECDAVIEQVLDELGGPPPAQTQAPSHPAKPGGVNTPQIEGLHRILVRLCGGKDATRLPGMADNSLLQVIGEVGTDLSKWPSDKHFTAWTGLAPGAAQSGKRRTRQARHRNRTGQLFCTMARSLARSVDKGFGGFYRRLKARRGGLVANKALARKLASMFWHVMVEGVEYVEQGLQKYEARVAATEQRTLRKLARKFNVEIVPKQPATTGVPG